MPELPEVEAMARLTRRLVKSKKILDCRVIHAAVAGGSTHDRQGTKALKQAKGRKILEVERRGKYLLLRLDRGWVAMHFRLSGQLLWYKREKPPEHVDVALDFARNTLGFVDRRHLGRVRWLDRSEDLPGIQQMGVDPLSREFTAKRLGEILGSSRRAVKLVLMDQQRVAGLGNIWSSEALWRAKIDPRRRADRIDAKETRRLRGAIVDVLRRALQSCLDPAPDFRDPEWEFQGAEKIMRVYDCEGQRCRRCGKRIQRLRQGNRSTYFCPGCQR